MHILTKPIILLFALLLFFQSNNILGQQQELNSTYTFLSSASNVVAKTNAFLAEIDAVSKRVQDSDAFEVLKNGKKLTFPIGVLPKSEDRNYALYIHGVRLEPQGVYATVSMKIRVNDEQSLYFLADRVPFNNNGFTGECKLYLLKDFKWEVGKGYIVKFNGMGSSAADSTYVTFDCKGFKNLMINGNLQLKPEVATPAADEANTTTATASPQRTASNNTGATGSDPATTGTATGKVDKSKKDTLDMKFYLQADRVTNFVVNFKDIPVLNFKALPGIKLIMPELTLDMSEVAAAPGVTLPTWYTDDTHYKGKYATPESWKGLYIPTTRLIVPGGLKGKDKTDTLIVKTTDLIVDEDGVTFDAWAQNVLDINKSNNKGFKFSIDSLNIELKRNAITKGGIFGKVSLPITSASSTLEYELLVFKAENEDPLWKGNINYTPNKPVKLISFGPSYAELSSANLAFTYQSGTFDPEVKLSGNIIIMASSKQKGDQAPESSGSVSDDEKKSYGRFVITCEDLTFRTKGELFDFKSVSMKNSGGSLSKLPIGISEFKLEKKDQNLCITLGIKVKLTKSGGDANGSNGFAANAVVKVYTYRAQDDNKWKFDYLELSHLDLHVAQGSFSIDGTLDIFKDDPVWGKGFCGKLKLVLVDKITVEAAAIFGKITNASESTFVDKTQYTSKLVKGGQADVLPTTSADGDGVAIDSVDTKISFRYWFVDAAVTFPMPIPIATGVGISGFNGGIYSRMKLYYPTDQNPTVATEPEKKGGTDGETPATQTDKTSSVDCQTVSGNVYKPNPNIHLGVLAGLSIQSLGNESIFNGNITFGIEFNTGGGIAMVALWGYVSVFNTPVPTKAEDVKKDENTDINEHDPDAQKIGQLGLTWFTQYRVEEKTFVGDFRMYINFMNGLVKGTMDTKNKAAEVNVYFSPSMWYVWAGIPAKMNSVSVFKFAELKSYFCAGHLPNPAMASIDEDIPRQLRPSVQIDQSLITNAIGLSFGARIKIGKDHRSKLWSDKLTCFFNATFKAGFDILISKANKPVYCSNVGERGFQGWYATGQAFAYANVGIGVGYKGKDYSLVGVELGASIFAQLPRPTYFEGNFYFKIDLGVLTDILDFFGVSLSGNVKVNFGETCKSQEDDKSVKYIDFLDPADGDTAVPVNSPISIYFLTPIREEFDLPKEGEGAGNYRLRPNVSEYSDVSLSYMLKGVKKAIPYVATWNASFDALTLVPKEVLPEGTEITTEVTVRMEQKNGSGWSGFGATTENRKETFKTYLEPEAIELSNIQYAYPMPDMKNFYRTESNKGYVKMNSVPRKAFVLPENTVLELQIVSGGKVIAKNRSIQINMTPGAENITFDIPSESLVNGQTYTLRIRKTNTTAQEDVIANEDGTVQGTLGAFKPYTVLEYAFTTSKFNNFAQKMAYYNVATVSKANAPVLSQSFKVGNVENVKTQLEEFLATEYNPIQSNNTVMPPLLRVATYDLSGMIYTSTNYKDFPVYYASNALVIDCKLIANKEANARDKIALMLANGASAPALPAAITTLGYKLGYFLPGKTTPNSVVNYTMTAQ